MKLFTMLAVCLLMVGLGQVAHAQVPTGPPGAVCNATNNLQGIFPGTISHDECVLYVESAQTQNPSEIAAACKIIQTQGVIPPGGAAFGNCVSSFHNTQGFGASRASVGVLGLLIACWAGLKAFRMRRGVFCQL